MTLSGEIGIPFRPCYYGIYKCLSDIVIVSPSGVAPIVIFSLSDDFKTEVFF